MKLVIDRLSEQTKEEVANLAADFNRTKEDALPALLAITSQPEQGFFGTVFTISPVGSRIGVFLHDALITSAHVTRDLVTRR